MAQLRHDYDQFVERDVEIIVVGPEDAPAFKKYWQAKSLPFIGLPDPRHSVLKLYGQQVKLFKMGRMPAQVLIDKAGACHQPVVPGLPLIGPVISLVIQPP